MKFRLIEDQRDTFPVRVVCDVMGVSPSGYYAWRVPGVCLAWPARKPAQGGQSRPADRDPAGPYDHRGRYGAPRIHAALRADGQTASRSRVERLMHHHGIRARTPRRFRVRTTDGHHDLPIAPNRLDQKFAAERPNQVWLADITYVPTGEGWLYLAVVLDLFTRKIVGRAMRDPMPAELTIAAPTMAIQRQKPPPGLPHHPDRGRQYAAAGYRKVHDTAGMIQSMSRKGNCWDNAPVESCFGTLKTELVHQACYKTHDAARHDLFVSIEGYSNRQRLHSALGYITPEQAERQAA
jgi:putative transposase